MDNKQIRAISRGKLKNTWALSIAVAAAAMLLGGMIQGNSFLPQVEYNIPLPFLDRIAETINEGLKIGRFTFTFKDGALGIVAFLMGGAIQLGYARFLLNQHDGEPIQFSDLYSQFHRFGKGFAQFFLTNLYTTLWTLCFFIPGIMAAYSYSMTPFLMADFPELSASEAIARSKDIMDGHKAELFLLDLSFFGWFLLCILTGNLGFLVLNPYTSAAHAVFYRQLQVGRPRYLPEN